MEFLDSFVCPVIVGLCLVVGYLFKSLSFSDNRFVPFVVCALGVLLSVWLYWPDITCNTLLTGAISGLASTGMYELFHQWIHKGGD